MNEVLAALIALAGGLAGGLVGVGGGVLFVPALAIFIGLSQVEAESTSLLMANFYRNLGEPGISNAKALQRAQLVLFDDKRFKHPYFWAPFLMIGNWM